MTHTWHAGCALSHQCTDHSSDGCSACVQCSAGVDTGMEMQVPLPHLAGAKGQKSPELLVRVEVMPDPVFVREGQDVHVDVPMGYSQAVLGGSVYVPTLTGQIKLKVHPGTPSGHVSIVRGKGEGEH